MSLFKKQGNEYKIMPFKLGPIGYCDGYKNLDVFSDAVREKTDVPDKDVCPWPAVRILFETF